MYYLYGEEIRQRHRINYGANRYPSIMVLEVTSMLMVSFDGTGFLQKQQMINGCVLTVPSNGLPCWFIAGTPVQTTYGKLYPVLGGVHR